MLSCGRYQCNACRRQTLRTIVTIMAGTRLALTVWFLGISLLPRSKNAISELELARQPGISYNSAWHIKS